MAIDSIGFGALGQSPAASPMARALANSVSDALGSQAAGSAKAGSLDFGQVLSNALANVDQSQNQADDLAKRFQLGDQSASLEQTMIAMQKANISFQGLVQVRNRVISAYHDIMSMQV
jgi:flagellar hook-basal body complex protein FliE